jgi:rare lipoprotein A
MHSQCRVRKNPHAAICDADHKSTWPATVSFSDLLWLGEGVKDRTKRANAAARLTIALLLVITAAPVLFACANLGAPPATLAGFEPYRVNGRTYVPLQKWEKYKEIGMASWYGGKFHGRTTANGERFDSRSSLTAAHRTLPFNVCAVVEHIPTGRSVIVRINDRGPFARGRLIDLSRAAAEELGVVDEGLVRVRVSARGVADADGTCRA